MGFLIRFKVSMLYVRVAGAIILPLFEVGILPRCDHVDLKLSVIPATKILYGMFSKNQNKYLIGFKVWNIYKCRKIREEHKHRNGRLELNKHDCINVQSI